MAVLRPVDGSPPISAGGQAVNSSQTTSQPASSNQPPNPDTKTHTSEEPAPTNAPPACEEHKDDAPKNPNNSNKKEEEQQPGQPQLTLPAADPPKSWKSRAEEGNDQLKEHLDLLRMPVYDFLCLAWNNGPLNGHVSLLIRDWRCQRERKRRGALSQAAQGQGQGNASGSGNQNQPDQAHVTVDDDRTLRPTEAELAMGMGLIALWIVCYNFAWAWAQFEMEQKGEQPGKYHWLAKPLASWSLKLAMWVGTRCLYRLWQSWWTGGFEGGRGLGSSTLVLFVLAFPCAVLSGLFTTWGELWTWSSLLNMLVRSMLS